MKVQAKHGKVTQIMLGASKNYRYVWDVSVTKMSIVIPLWPTPEEETQMLDSTWTRHLAAKREAAN